MCIVNGRMCSENDNYTSVSVKGSDVDYLSVLHDDLDNCIYFKVHLIKDVMTRAKTYHDKLPDHSILEVIFTTNVLDMFTLNSSNEDVT